MPIRRSTGELAALTGLRGVAAWWVVLYHFHYAPNPGWGLRQIADNGYLAVDLFFALSGFLMLRSYRGLFETRCFWEAFRTFMLRRLARVYPLYLLASALFIALCAAGLGGGEPLTPLAVALNLTMTQHWFTRINYDPPCWSISAEFAAYLLFPLLLLWVRRSGWTLAWTALACLGIICTLAISPEAPTEWHLGPLLLSKGSPVHALLRCLTDFMLGMIGLRASEQAWTRRALQSRLFTTAVPVAFVLLLALPDQGVAITALMPVLLVTLTAEPSAAARLLASRPARFLGDISYAVYLFHWLLGLAPLHGAARALAYLALIAGAWLLHRWVERPARFWIRRLEWPRRAVPAEAIP